MKRRGFVRDIGMMAGAGLVSSFAWKKSDKVKGNGMNLTCKRYELRLRHQFTIAEGSRSTTPVMLTEITLGDLTGYGEASMPPYLPENYETAEAFLSKVDLSPFNDPLKLDDVLRYVDGISPGNYAAKASVDIALHDLAGKARGLPWYRIWGLDPERTPFTSFTIGMDKPEVVREKTKEASPYRILKVKLGLGHDREIIEAVRSVTDKPLCVDINQGWTDRKEALDMIYWLKEKGVVFVEQPMSKSNFEDAAWLTERSPLPVMADEAFQTISDLKKVSGAYSGVNVKLMKCGGMRSGYEIIQSAKKLGMKIMIGCMTETSCAVSAAAQLSPLADWADLDGNLLISNDPFTGVLVKEGKITLNDLPGIGIAKISGS
jgi:L-Ala-D/L-Glu epimerase